MQQIKNNRILILADIHSNNIALQEVLRDISKRGYENSKIIVNGDVISLGPCPQECFELLSEFNDISFILGNNDRYIINHNFANMDNFHADMYKQVPQGLRDNLTWTYNQLSPENLEKMKKWPRQIVFKVSKYYMSVSHGTPEDDEENINSDISDQDLVRRFNEYDLYVFSHTHVPFVRKINDKLFINPGSVGSSLDGDRRASYAILTLNNDKWEVKIHRISYDLNKVVDLMNNREVPWRKSILKILFKASF